MAITKCRFFIDQGERRYGAAFHAPLAQGNSRPLPPPVTMAASGTDCPDVSFHGESWRVSGIAQDVRFV
jgi:hypothetical protein